MIGLHRDPWISGTIVVAYYGAVCVEVRDRDYERGIQRLEEAMQERAESVGATDVVGMEVSVDPFAVPPIFHGVGTAAKLERLWR